MRGSKPILSEDVQARLQSVATLKEAQCRCGHPKQTGMAFCFGCWQQLPVQIRRALYRPAGPGFMAAYDGAVSCLRLQAREEEQ